MKHPDWANGIGEQKRGSCKVTVKKSRGEEKSIMDLTVVSLGI